MNLIKHDFRAHSLDIIISSLSSAIDDIEKFSEENPWYDGLFVLEDTEHIFGLACIAFQNYINASIKDLTQKGGKDLQLKYYRFGEKLPLSKYTIIELIIALANYIKHKEDDDKEFHKHTKQILSDFNLNTDKDCDINESAIFGGLDLLDTNWVLANIQKRVENWRGLIADSILPDRPTIEDIPL